MPAFPASSTKRGQIYQSSNESANYSLYVSLIAVPAEDFTAWLFSFRFPPTRTTVPLPEPLAKTYDHINVWQYARLTTEDGEDDVDVGEEEEEQELVTAEHW